MTARRHAATAFGSALLALVVGLGLATLAQAQDVMGRPVQGDTVRQPMRGQMHGQTGGMMGMCPMMCGMMGMGGMMGGMAPTPPPVQGYSEGEVAFFIHTEASDRDIARLLTQMMASPVLYVPALADLPDKLLVPIYVFTNGVKDGGPLGFQHDVLPNPPSWQETGAYSPLRRLHKVTWRDPGQARVLKSAQEVQEAQRQGLVTIERTNVVINAPMVVWPLGRR
jgi:hypothetical protein